MCSVGCIAGVTRRLHSLRIGRSRPSQSPPLSQKTRQERGNFGELELVVRQTHQVPYLMVTLTAFDVMPFTCTQIVAGPFTPEGFTTSNFVETVFVPVATPIVLKLCVGW